MNFTYNVLSAADLLNYKKTGIKHPPKKIDKNSDSREWYLNNFYQEYELTLTEERVQERGDLSYAVFYTHDSRIELLKNKGKFWQVMGYVMDGKRYLYPEEALFLLEASQLEITRDNTNLSILEGYQLLMNQDCSLEQYQIYSHLTRLGYSVIRHKKRSQSKDADDSAKLEDENKPEMKTNNSDTNEIHKEVSETSRKKIKLSKMKSNNQTSIDNMLSISEQPSCNLRDFSDVNFPSIAHNWIFKLPIPSPDCLPPNVKITDSMCTVNVHNIYKSNRPRHLSPDRSFSFHRSSWSSYRRSTLSYNFKDREIEDYPKTFSFTSSKAKCWADYVKELRISQDIKSSLLDKLKIIKPATALDGFQFSPDSLKYTYDVYLPTEDYKKSTEQLPNHRLIITSATDPSPCFPQLCALDAGDRVPIHFAFASCGEVFFYSFEHVQNLNSHNAG